MWTYGIWLDLWVEEVVAAVSENYIRDTIEMRDSRLRLSLGREREIWLGSSDSEGGRKQGRLAMGYKHTAAPDCCR